MKGDDEETLDLNPFILDLDANKTYWIQIDPAYSYPDGKQDEYIQVLDMKPNECYLELYFIQYDTKSGEWKTIEQSSM